MSPKPFIAAFALILPLCAIAQQATPVPKIPKAPPAQPFARYDSCTYLPQTWNDGDSFHVRMPDGKEQVLRLYFVDTPESENSFPERVAQQAAYFGITSEQSLRVGKDATVFTKAVLSKPFTVQTRWRKALGRSKLPRYYAMIFTAEGKDLAELLVSSGLVRIYGTRTLLPDGRDSREYLAGLEKSEAVAKAAKLGGWGYGAPAIGTATEPAGSGSNVEAFSSKQK